MPVPLVIVLVLALVAASLLCSTLTYALRDYSKVVLEARLEKFGKSKWYERTVERTGDLIFATAIGRLMANLLMLIGIMHLFRHAGLQEWAQYTLTIIVTCIVTLICSVTVPHALAEHAGESMIAYFAPFLHRLRATLLPITDVMHVVDRLVGRIAAPANADEQAVKEEQIEQEILSVVQEGADQGVVDPVEREMIQRVIGFHDTRVGQTMTARPDIIGLPLTAELINVRSVIEESGHSRIPVYDGTIDHIVGVLYARDLLQYLAATCDEVAKRFDIRSAMRPAFLVPESRSLRDLLKDFRVRKVHMAIVLDEYGGTAGLVTIEDLLEELVGEMSDEHEPIEPELFKRLSDGAAEADARIYVGQLNRLLGLHLPEDAGYDTLGGFVATTLGLIPQAGAEFVHDGATYKVIEAEPTKVKRVQIELKSAPELEPNPTGAA